MRYVCVVVAFLSLAAPACAQTKAPKQQPKLEILTGQGDFYWVVETAPDGSRKGGWVNAQVALERIDRSALKPLPTLPTPEEPQNAASVNERLLKLEQALAAGPR